MSQNCGLKRLANGNFTAKPYVRFTAAERRVLLGQGGTNVVKRTLAILSMWSVFCAVPIFAQQDQPQPPDNTKVNKQNGPTADQATNNRSDRELMQQIRKSLVDDKSLSSYAHNVKIIATHGKVTLKGPVTSEEERHTVEQKAADVAGAGNVTNELTIKAARVKRNKS